MGSIVGPVAVAALMSLALVACGDGDGESEAAGETESDEATIAAPAKIRDAGRIVYCSDISYPPMEFFEGTTPKGVDIEIGDEVARRFGVTAEYENTGFSAIISALEAGKCDVVNSSLGVTPERSRRVDYARYALFGLSMIVTKGNPAGIATVDDLAGKRVAVQVGSTTKAFADEQSRRLARSGQPPIEVLAFDKDTDAASALTAGKVDAYISDTPPAAWYVSQNPDQFELAGEPLEGVPVGLAVRKGDRELLMALRRAVSDMYADGTVERILQKWDLTELLLPASERSG
jgi:polar amino acid transport system substrate-binding protein